MTDVVDAYMVVGGRFHDFDHARLELLRLCAEQPTLRVSVGSCFADVAAISASRFLITYTCDVRPSPEQQDVLIRFLEAGGRWLALHSSNVLFDTGDDGIPRASPVEDRYIETLGSRFVDHPPISKFLVEPTDSSHPLVEGLAPFEVEDEQYVNAYPDRSALTPLLETAYDGRPCAVDERLEAGTQLVAYLRRVGRGAVYFNSLGHCRGPYDFRPHINPYPEVERCSWGQPVFRELLRRGIEWGMSAPAG